MVSAWKDDMKHHVQVFFTDKSFTETYECSVANNVDGALTLFDSKQIDRHPDEYDEEKVFGDKLIIPNHRIKEIRIWEIE